MDFQSFLEAVNPEDRPKILEQTELALGNSDHVYKCEYRIQRPDGSERIVFEEAIIRRNRQGDPQRMTGIIQDITKRRRVEKEKEALIAELRRALSTIKQLNGLLPICAHCKRIRDDKGYWERIENYISKHTDAEFSHGICPDCVKELYPELVDDDFPSRDDPRGDLPEAVRQRDIGHGKAI